MAPRKLRSTLALVVLALLTEEPLHPYAMRQRIAERTHDRLPGVRTASLYDAVQRLAGAGLVSAGEPSRAGNRPERVVYALTDAGREALTGWVADALADADRREEFPAALSFMYSLGRTRVVELLRGRADALGRSIAAEEASLDAVVRDGVPAIFVSEGRYRIALRRAERDFIDAFLEGLRSGALVWPAYFERS